MLALDDDSLLAALRSLNPDASRRARYLLPTVLRRNFSALSVVESLRPPLRFAYSVKTNPHRTILDMACKAGLYAEVISSEELTCALEAGFENRTIYNGPVPAWRLLDAPGIVFSDSIQAYVQNVQHLEGALVGIRYRPDGVRSRFGIPQGQREELREAVRASGRRTIGVSLHVRPEDYGGRTWRGIVASGLEFARTLQAECDIKVTTFDVGGGKTPEAFDEAIAAGDFAWLLRESMAALPYAHAVFAEPGQAVVTPAGLVVAPVLEIRRERGRTDVVVDAGYPDLPQIRTFTHRAVAIMEDGVELLAAGSDRILGCTCLEYDVIRNNVRLPASLDKLRAIVIADAGAYDSSMGFDFARGGNSAVDDREGVPRG